MNAIETHFLRDTDHGGLDGQPKEVAQLLADFAGTSSTSLHLAIYDFRLDEPLAGIVVQALTQAADRGVEVRLTYDHGGKAAAQAAAPPGELSLGFAERGADPAPPGTHQWLHEHFDGTAVALRAIDPGDQIMHHKYVIRDGGSPDARVWTGSTNFTSDAWTHQENNIVILASPDLATGYERDFAELWRTGRLAGTGEHDQGSATVDGSTLEWDFAPGDGPAIDADLTAMIDAARSRVDVASMVLTSETILGALADASDRGVALAGIYDAGQMGPIVRQWKKTANGRRKAALFEQVAEHLVGKKSEPFTPTSKHNFMHDKVLVCDDTVSTGSFNFSRNAAKNAENAVVSAAAELAGRYRDAIGEITAAYRR
ncbi:phospholipase D-like domain-containing protein [Actinomycetospora endophytica]|uniref:phospholipase D n=1 Tax=Actinomycetospora endophytica TaxID=2291215 RepID=A0ABS8P617_9PSEU|nr:phospholipase D-like domain-containing protein [Actinomycetospora endophytica]MCD2193698.1 phospholipase D-like domain-containing protein [Actinomycetospora endophytica]